MSCCELHDFIKYGAYFKNTLKETDLNENKTCFKKYYILTYILGCRDSAKVFRFKDLKLF